MSTGTGSDGSSAAVPKPNPSAASLPVLVIDGDKERCRLTADYLKPFGFSVEYEHTGWRGAACEKDRRWDAVILNGKLPDVDGLEVLRIIRAKSKVPVLMIMERDREADRVTALEIGADDCVPHAISSRELLAHLRAVVRRMSWVNEGSRRASARYVNAGLLRICLDTRTAALSNHTLTLTRTEFDLLLILARAKGSAKTRDQLVEVLRGSDWKLCDRAVDVHICSLRKKLGDDQRNWRFIRTVRGVGYMLVAPES